VSWDVGDEYLFIAGTAYRGAMRIRPKSERLGYTNRKRYIKLFHGGRVTTKLTIWATIISSRVKLPTANHRVRSEFPKVPEERSGFHPQIKVVCC
jgi:hypothetical protein